MGKTSSLRTYRVLAASQSSDLDGPMATSDSTRPLHTFSFTTAFSGGGVSSIYKLHVVHKLGALATKLGLERSVFWNVLHIKIMAGNLLQQ